ncbi:exodeoxyribonuclease V subunit gamma [Candidatus Vallotia cooleyia]|uniref:exodeoxyribonuclease V subunit gamma n=1 Tax=Candidatus Vallotiella adelgis TaxID=1177211 RepID=UPI001D03100A|nr:exodeoxyribonuclease V subunit gamma [Candidatus Vallotia cooleyia]
MLKLFYSNRYETLSAALLEDLNRRGGDLWQPQPIIVPNVAVRRRLELDYANLFGLCANIEFCHLAEWLWAQIARVDAIDMPQESPFLPERLVWRLYRLLVQRGTIQDSVGQSSLTRLDAYLTASDSVMIFDLSRRISAVFDRYMTYRSHWLAQWMEGASIFAPYRQNIDSKQFSEVTPIQHADEAWQAQLWRDVLNELAGVRDADADILKQVLPPEYRFLSVVSQFNLDDVKRADWPAQVSVFALPTMPPLHMQLLCELSRWIDVQIYVLIPCRKLWFDIVTQQCDGVLHAAGQPDYKTVGHPLLSEWGRQMQAQLVLLHQHTKGVVASENSEFVEATACSWLATIQNFILRLDHPVLPSPLPTRNGIEVHVCHSLMRQFEVLHDRLLAEFNSDSSLMPDEVLIVVPDLMVAAPIVNAVFGAVSSDDLRHIPYHITGLPSSKANLLARTLLEWLTLAENDVNASTLIEWLHVDAIAARYSIDPLALNTVQKWLFDAGARRLFAPSNQWNTNVPHSRNTFSDALMRLFLGYAMPDNSLPVGDWLPVAAPIGADAILLGRLAKFIDELDAFARACSIPHTVAQWRKLLFDALERFFDFFSSGVDALSQLLAAVFVQIEAGAPHTLLPAVVLRAALLSALDALVSGGVPSGAVTVSSLSGLRGVPFRIVCIAGIDADVFPSRSHEDEFNLMAAFSQPGDCQYRDNERNLFLDLILAARDTVLLSYTGRSIQDNTDLLPSALVTELLDHLALLKAGEGAVLDRIALARSGFITDHPLQPFALSYFSIEGPLLTYDEDRAQVASALSDPKKRIELDIIRPFFINMLPPDMRETIRLDEFLRFWHHPQRTILREQLGIILHRSQPLFPDNTAYKFDYVARDALSRRLLPLLIDSSAYADRAYEIARSIPELPGGATGRAMHEREIVALRKMAEYVQRRTGTKLETVDFSIRIIPSWPKNLKSVSVFLDLVPATQGAVLLPTVLTGALNTVKHDELVLYRYTKPTTYDYLDAWLRHLCWCAASPKASRKTLWIGEEERFVLTTPRDPHMHLGELIAMYRVGLRVPLRFFPKSAWLFVSKSESIAQNAWSNTRTGGEFADPAIQLVLRGMPSTLDDTFFAISKIVFEPLIAHMRLSEDT